MEQDMESWIRYSVAVYVGLLLAGAAINPGDIHLGPAASADTAWYDQPMLIILPVRHNADVHDVLVKYKQPVHAQDSSVAPLRWSTAKSTPPASL